VIISFCALKWCWVTKPSSSDQNSEPDPAASDNAFHSYVVSGVFFKMIFYNPIDPMTKIYCGLPLLNFPLFASKFEKNKSAQVYLWDDGCPELLGGLKLFLGSPVDILSSISLSIILG